METNLIAKALLENDKKAQESLDHNILLMKAPAWRYEKEWRLFGNQEVQDSVLALKDITFGLRCPVAIVHAVIAALETRDQEIKFYKIYEVRENFKLKRRIVVTCEMRVFLPKTARSGIVIFGPVEVNAGKATPSISFVN